MAPSRPTVKPPSSHPKFNKIFHTGIIPPAPCSKVHKRAAKHAFMIQRLQTSIAAARLAKSAKRRRTAKKTVNLSALEDALPSVAKHPGSGSKREADGERKTGFRKDSATEPNRLRQKSIKSQPGAGKRKEKMLQLERERFAKTLAIMAAGKTADRGSKEKATFTTTGNTQQNNHEESVRARWTAIQDFLGRTLDKRDTN